MNTNRQPRPNLKKRIESVTERGFWPLRGRFLGISKRELKVYRGAVDVVHVDHGISKRELKAKEAAKEGKKYGENLKKRIERNVKRLAGDY